MNDFLARELIDVLKHMAASQRMMEKHLATMRCDINALFHRENLMEYEVQGDEWDMEHEHIENDREGVKNYHDTK
jgi:hypothetical protein